MSNEVTELLLKNNLIRTDQRPSSSGQYVVRCFVKGVCSDSKTPKLYINADEENPHFGLWNCMRCGACGNLEMLQKQFTPPTRKEILYKKAHEIWVRALAKNDEAQDYLKDRGFTEDDIVTFGYGYADESYVDTLLEWKFTEEELIKHGLLREKEGKVSPNFWDHIIIPYKRAGKYTFFQGRSLDPKAKVRYMNMTGQTVPLYHAEDLYKVSGRVWLTEGAFKRDTLATFGELSTAIGGTNQFDKYITDLNECNNLWIVLDVDANGAGQKAAEELAQSLSHCHVVTLPLGDRETKIGVDDFVLSQGIEALHDLADKYGVEYQDGEPQRSENLYSVVESIADSFYKTTGRLGYDVGHKRFMQITDGFQRGALSFVAGGPHMGKSVLLRDLADRLYEYNDELLIDYYSHDDSLKLTIAHWVAQIACLNSSDVRHPQVAFKDDRERMRDWERGVKQLQGMYDRLKILDSSYRRTLDQMYEDLCRWRELNPDGHRIIIIDGFSNTHFTDEKTMKDQGMLAIRRSSMMKRIAQEADIPFVSTCEIPKLYGKRPASWDLRDSGQLEYDVDVLLTVYQEAQAKGGLDLTDMKILTEYSDGNKSDNPIVEIKVAKDKMNGGTNKMILMELHKDTSTYEELDDANQRKFQSLIFKQESEKKRSFKSQ